MTYALIIFALLGGGSSMTTTPMATQQLCFEAMIEAKKLARTVSVICVRTS